MTQHKTTAITTLDDIINAIRQTPHLDTLVRAKKQYAKHAGVRLPTNMQLLHHLTEHRGDIDDSMYETLRILLSKRKIRSQSGIVPIQVLTKHFWCPGECIFCPNDETMPKSYINTEPGAMRALLNNFDPRKQVRNRLLSLNITGHKTDKIEMIVLGGTWDVYPDSYKEQFIRELFDACNTFDEFVHLVDVRHDNPTRTQFVMPDELPPVQSQTMEDAHRINETTAHRIIGLTVETRPEYVTHTTCRQRRERGITRLEIGIQSMFDDVLDANKR